MDGVSNTIGGAVNTVVNWQFLQEPAWRWAIFFAGSSAFLMVWNDVLSLMK